MTIVEIRIRGVSPLLMARFTDEARASIPGGKDASTRSISAAVKDPRTEAQKSAYITQDGELYMPSAALVRCFREAAGNFKQRGRRQSMKYVAAAALLPTSDVMLFDPTVRTFEVDARPAVIPSTKGRIMAYRARIEQWTLHLFGELDEMIVDMNTAHEIMNIAGRSIGIGAFRPEKGGPFGRFVVEQFSVFTDNMPESQQPERAENLAAHVI